MLAPTHSDDLDLECYFLQTHKCVSGHFYKTPVRVKKQSRRAAGLWLASVALL